jgi:hypothetical protein
MCVLVLEDQVLYKYCMFPEHLSAPSEKPPSPVFLRMRISHVLFLWLPSSHRSTIDLHRVLVTLLEYEYTWYKYGIANCNASFLIHHTL